MLVQFLRKANTKVSDNTLLMLLLSRDNKGCPLSGKLIYILYWTFVVSPFRKVEFTVNKWLLKKDSIECV